MQSNRVLNLAERLASGDEVDWDTELRSSPNEQDRALLRGMRLLAGISALHRGGFLQQTASIFTADFSTTLPPAPPQSWGRLQQLQRIGQGRFGTVYKAWDPLLEIWVALKLARSDSNSSLEDMLEESRLLARLRHEHIVRIYGVEAREDGLGIWMELVNGRTLDHIVKSEGPMSEAEAVEIGRTLAQALAEVHGAGVIHKDIKAHNVMREAGGRIVLMDFGAGSRTDETMDDGASRSLRGTPYYLAPEVLGGKQPGRQSDIYSLGVLLFFLVTKRHPVEAETLKGLRNAHHAGRRSVLADVRPQMSPRFCAIVEKALDADPTQRYESAGRMAHALASLQRQRFDWRPWAAVGVAAVLLLAALWLWNESKSYSVESILFRAAQTNQQLLPGSRVGPGDRIFLELQSDKSLYVYVLNQDATGLASLLFPVQGLSGNPLAANEKHHLPGVVENRPIYWVVTSAGERERFLVVASRRPLPDLERILQDLPSPGFRGEKVEYPRLELSHIGELRGILGLSEGEPTTEPAGTDLLDQVTALTNQREKQRGIWVRRIDLDNPEP